MTIEIPPDARPAGPDAPAEVVEAFTAAVVTTFQELSSTAVALREPVLASTSLAIGDINAVIDLKRRLPGRLVCAFPQVVLEALTHSYLPAGTPLSQEILDDTAGEFANVIAGQAKTMLKGTPYHYALSIPAVSREPIVSADFESERGQLLLLFDTEKGDFVLQVILPACP